MFTLPIEPLLAFILVLIRVLMFFSFLPVFSQMFLPVRIRVLAAAGVSFIFFPIVEIPPEVFPRTLSQMVALMAPEAMLGMAFGLVGSLAFAAFQFAGKIVEQEIGFHMSAVMDPAHGGQTPLMAQVFYACAVILFFTIEAHHVFFAALARSFQSAPPGFLRMSTDLTPFLNEQAARLFVIGLQMSLPVMAVVLMINVGLLMVGKSLPQLNVLLESFPIRIMVGFFMLSVTIGLVIRQMAEVLLGLEDALLVVLRLVGG